MTFAINFLVHFQHALVLNRGNFVMPGVEMRIGQLMQAIRGIDRRGIWRRVRMYGLLQDGDSLIVFAAIGQHRAQRDHGVRDFWIVRRQVAFIHFQRLADQALRFFVLRLLFAQGSQRQQALCRLGTVGSKNGLARAQRGLQKWIGLIVLAQFLVNAAKRFEEFRLHRRLGVEAARFLDAAIEQRHYA